MLTRREVAARLRRSVATVRRLEGVLLFPRTDYRGIHRFHEADVKDLAARMRAGEIRLWQEIAGRYRRSDWRAWLTVHTRQPHASRLLVASSPAPMEANQPAEAQIAVLKRENEDLRQAARQLVDIVLAIGPAHTIDAIANDLLEIAEKL